MPKTKEWLQRHSGFLIRWAPLLGLVAAWLLDVGIVLLLDVVAYASDCPPGGYLDCASAASTAQNPLIPGLGGLLGVGARMALGAPIYGPPNTGQPPVNLPPQIPIAGGAASSAPGTLMPDGHTVLSPDDDPYRLTDYPDFVQWMIETLRWSALTGTPPPQNLIDLLNNNPGLTTFLPPGPPASFPPPPPPPTDTMVQSGNDAINHLATLYPGRVHLAPGPQGQPNYPWVEAPRDGEGLPTGLSGVAYQTAELVDPANPTGPRIKVFDPNNTAIARDWNHPPDNLLTQTTIPPSTDTTALAAQLNGLVTTPGMQGFNLTPQLDAAGNRVLVVPENTPPGVSSIAYATKAAIVNGQHVRVIDQSRPIITRHW